MLVGEQHVKVQTLNQPANGWVPITAIPAIVRQLEQIYRERGGQEEQEQEQDMNEQEVFALLDAIFESVNWATEDKRIRISRDNMLFLAYGNTLNGQGYDIGPRLGELIRAWRERREGEEHTNQP